MGTSETGKGLDPHPRGEALVTEIDAVCTGNAHPYIIILFSFVAWLIILCIIYFQSNTLHVVTRQFIDFSFSIHIPIII
jgi:hypothetical protein